MKARYHKHTLFFKNPSGTSRGILTEKETYFLILEADGRKGVGECSLLKGLSPDPLDRYEATLDHLCNALMTHTFTPASLVEFPSIAMGLEMARLSLKGTSPFGLFDTSFSRGDSSLPINGLIWMGEFEFMKAQIESRLADGFDCIKMKIGALEFRKELRLLDQIRQIFSAEEVVLRVDANGAFGVKEAMKKLTELAVFDLHSIEQPIAAGQVEAMHHLCQNSPIPIALDEELIGIQNRTSKERILDAIAPHYIILKPSLLGGFQESQEWIDLAEQRGIGWWITSALESNVGLNAIAQWTATLGITLPQGLGTGGLYTNNIPSPLVAEKGYLRYADQQLWQFNM